MKVWDLRIEQKIDEDNIQYFVICRMTVRDHGVQQRENAKSAYVPIKNQDESCVIGMCVGLPLFIKLRL